MDKKQKLTRLLEESRNGTDGFHRLTLSQKLPVSDGVRDVAVVIGAFWMLDILSTEMIDVWLEGFNSDRWGNCLIECVVEGSKMDLWMSARDGETTHPWSRHISYTDFPEGKWVLFEVGPFGADSLPLKRGCLILLSEH